MLAVAALFAAFSPTAQAARQADVAVSVSLPTFQVDQAGTVSVTVENQGRRNASQVTVDVLLPETANAPTAYLMGQLSNVDSACVQVGTALECSVGRLRRGRSQTLSFDIALSQSADAL